MQDLIFIKSLETNTLQLSSTNKLELNLNNTGSISKDSDGLYINLKEVTNINKSGLKSDLNWTHEVVLCSQLRSDFKPYLFN